MVKPTSIAIDWGSSTFRAYLVDEIGTVLAKVSTNEGVMQVPEGRFIDVLMNNCGDWLDEHCFPPVVMSGTIGSRNGWREAPYLPCPVSIKDLQNQSLPIENDRKLDLQVMPGVRGDNMFGGNDVMRGEEVQIFGAMDILNLESALVCLPGTHSKWCEFKNGEIVSLTTFMTGEMFALIRNNSAIGTLVEDNDFDQSSFLIGAEACCPEAGLLNRLFSIRADTLLGDLSCRSRASYLSGMLIGREILAVRKAMNAMEGLVLVGNEALTHKYSTVLAIEGVQTHSVTGDCAFLAGMCLLSGA